MGLCRGSTPATCQRRVRHQAHWCRGLARLPTTPHCQTAGNVVDIADNAFRDCKLLNIVLAPGCRDFGYKAFAECCSLQWVYASDGAANVFNGEANFGQYLFQGCINLAEVTLSVRFHPPEGQHCKSGLRSSHRAASAPRESTHLPSQSTLWLFGRTRMTAVDCFRVWTLVTP